MFWIEKFELLFTFQYTCIKDPNCKGYVYKNDCKENPQDCAETKPCILLSASDTAATIDFTGWTWYQCDCCDSGCDSTSEIVKD